MTASVAPGRSELPLLPTTLVGSWPRTPQVSAALRARRAGRITPAEFDQVADDAVLEVLRIQESLGLDVVTDGEQRRGGFFEFVSEKLAGTRLMPMSEMLDYVEDKAGYEEMLRIVDMPSFAMFSPIAVDRIRRRDPIVLSDYAFLRRHTDKPIKVTLPGPYLLTRAMWLQGVSEQVYPRKEDLGDDVVAVLRAELDALVDAGVDFVQFDEPVLSELVFSSSVTSRVFMCASLSIRNTPDEELALAVDLVNRVVASARGRGTRLGVHVCRGNWSTQEDVLLKGPYAPLLPHLERMDVDQLVLEYATPRAGSVADVAGTGKELGLGVVNPRLDVVEPAAAVAARIRDAAQRIPAERLFVNPDCGFGTFARRPVSDHDGAMKKVHGMVQAAHQLRAQL